MTLIKLMTVYTDYYNRDVMESVYVNPAHVVEVSYLGHKTDRYSVVLTNGNVYTITKKSFNDLMGGTSC